jgi:hypothetical protein
MYSTNAIMFNASDYSIAEVSAAMKSNKYQIYLITKRKKLIFDHCEHSEDGNQSWFYMLDEHHNKHWMDVKHPTYQFLEKSDNAGFTRLVTNGVPAEVRNFTVVNNLQPYREITGDKSLNGTLIKRIWPSDLEVVYIGQSFGNMNTRIAKHEKIKEVALRVIDDSSNEEVIVICVDCAANDNVFGVISTESRPDVSAGWMNRLQKKAAKRISAQQLVTLYESSLISYFKPFYNTEYKESFISRGFKSYDQIYNADFHYVSASIAMPEEFKTRIWSQHVSQPAFTHSDYFPLETQEQKKSLFEFLLDQSTFDSQL